MTIRAHINTSTQSETLYYSQWRCPVCPRAIDVAPPLFKIDCRDGHDWAAMIPVGEPVKVEREESAPRPPGPNVGSDGKAFQRAADLEPKCRHVLDDCGGVCCLLPGHDGEHECCGDSPGWPGSCPA